VRFNLNVSTLFMEVPLLDRFALAAQAGFAAVESWWPEDADPGAYAQAIREVDCGWCC
jgi:hydroxypyruvate isomerase